MTLTDTAARPDRYDDDPCYDYSTYWNGRDYEHTAEALAIRRLLGGRRFQCAVDVGGGFGRLSKLLAEYAQDVVLAEPSRHQLELAGTFLADEPRIECRQAAAADLRLPAASVDLLLLVRVLHHIPDPRAEFAEFARVVRPGGALVLEFANSANMVNRLRFARQGKRVPRHPVCPIAAPEHGEWDMPFVNHRPATILAQLDSAGFHVERVLSGSNLRSAFLKRVLPLRALLSVERALQPLLGPVRFGPSMWLVAHRKTSR